MLTLYFLKRLASQIKKRLDRKKPYLFSTKKLCSLSLLKTLNILSITFTYRMLVFDITILLWILVSRIKVFFLKRDDIWAVVHVPVWGKYVDTYLSFLQKNLSAEPNLSFSSQKKVLILFNCTSEASIAIRNSLDYEIIEKNYKIKFFLFPKMLTNIINKNNCYYSDSIYILLGTLQSYALWFSTHMQTSLIPLHPDLMIEEEFFLKIYQIIQKKYSLILSSPFRCDLRKIKNFIFNAGLEKNKELSFSGQEIVDLQCRFIHKISLKRILSPEKNRASLTPQMIFKESNTLVVKAFTWTPLFIDKNLTQNWKKKFFLPIDDDLCFLVKKNVKIFFLRKANELGVCELSGPKTQEAQCKRINFSWAETVYYHFKDISLNRLFFFNQKLIFKPTFTLKIKNRETNTNIFNKAVFNLYEKREKQL